MDRVVGGASKQDRAGRNEAWATAAENNWEQAEVGKGGLPLLRERLLGLRVSSSAVIVAAGSASAQGTNQRRVRRRRRSKSSNPALATGIEYDQKRLGPFFVLLLRG
jgi:hypothetical protein